MARSIGHLRWRILDAVEYSKPGEKRDWTHAAPGHFPLKGAEMALQREAAICKACSGALLSNLGLEAFFALSSSFTTFFF